MRPRNEFGSDGKHADWVTTHLPRREYDDAVAAILEQGQLAKLHVCRDDYLVRVALEPVEGWRWLVTPAVQGPV